jgi:hypothetical protein
MLRSRNARSPESFTHSPIEQPQHADGSIRLAPRAAPFVRRQLSRDAARALEILGHAIEYLADEYAVDPAGKGPLGNADPRVEAIQVLKALNRSIYFSGTEVQPAFRRIRRWFLGWRAP